MPTSVSTCIVAEEFLSGDVDNIKNYFVTLQ